MPPRFSYQPLAENADLVNRYQNNPFIERPYEAPYIDYESLMRPQYERESSEIIPEFNEAIGHAIGAGAIFIAGTVIPPVLTGSANLLDTAFSYIPGYNAYNAYLHANVPTFT